MIRIFTDGSFRNGKKILCGYGIYFPDGQLDNG